MHVRIKDFKIKKKTIKKNKGKKKKCDLIKLTSFCTAKKTSKKQNKTTYRLGKSITNDAFPSAYSPKYINRSYNSTTTNNSIIKKWAEDLNRHFSKEDIQMASGHIINLRKMQIQATMRYHLTPDRTAIIKMSTNKKRWRGYG